MAVSIYQAPQFSDQLLRRKDGTDNDPDWAGLALPPNTLLIEVGGTATTGNYDIQVTPDPDAGLTTPDLVRYAATAPPDTNPDIASGLVTELDTEIADTLANYYTDAFIATAAGTSFIGLTLRPDAPGHTLTLTAPGAGTLISPCDGYLPLAARTSNMKPANAEQRTALALAFVAVDSSGNPLPDDNGCTFSVEIVRTVERCSRYDAPNEPVRTPGVTSSTTTTGHSLTDEFRIPFDGGEFGVRLSSIATTPTSYSGIEIRWRQVEE